MRSLVPVLVASALVFAHPAVAATPVVARATDPRGDANGINRGIHPAMPVDSVQAASLPGYDLLAVRVMHTTSGGLVVEMDLDAAPNAAPYRVAVGNFNCFVWFEYDNRLGTPGYERRRLTRFCDAVDPDGTAYPLPFVAAAGHTIRWTVPADVLARAGFRRGTTFTSLSGASVLRTTAGTPWGAEADVHTWPVDEVTPVPAHIVL